MLTWFHADKRDAPNGVPVIGVAYENGRWKAAVFVYRTGVGYIAEGPDSNFYPTHWAHLSPELVSLPETMR